MRKNQKLGQHFLDDPAAAKDIVAAAGIGPDDLVIEIGPGKGALTQFLIEQARRVVGIELDRSFCNYLHQHFDTLSLVNQDVLEVDLMQTVRREGYDRAILVGNLPYQITGAAIERILAARSVWKCAVVMVQREVGRRMVSPPGGKEYGILSVAVQIWTNARCLFDLGPGHFQPPPRVHSSVVRLVFPETPPVKLQDERFFFRLVRAAFQQRRKMLKNTLGNQVSVSESVLLVVLRQADVDPRSRPEVVSGAQFEKICRVLKGHLDDS